MILPLGRFCPLFFCLVREPRGVDGVCVEAQKVRGPTREGVCRSVPRFMAAGRWLVGSTMPWDRLSFYQK
jgi:hypothetical protein